MAEPFDPYYKWLGIPPKDQPPHYYRLLGIERFEPDREVIDAAANRVMVYLKSLATGDQLEHTQKLLNEVAAARQTLLHPQRKAAYDEQLGVAETIPVALPARTATPPPVPPPPRLVTAEVSEAPQLAPPIVEWVPPAGSVDGKGRNHRWPVLFWILAGTALLLVFLIYIVTRSAATPSRPVRPLLASNSSSEARRQLPVSMPSSPAHSAAPSGTDEPADHLERPPTSRSQTNLDEREAPQETPSLDTTRQALLEYDEPAMDGESAPTSSENPHAPVVDEERWPPVEPLADLAPALDLPPWHRNEETPLAPLPGGQLGVDGSRIALQLLGGDLVLGEKGTIYLTREDEAVNRWLIKLGDRFGEVTPVGLIALEDRKIQFAWRKSDLPMASGLRNCLIELRTASHVKAVPLRAPKTASPLEIGGGAPQRIELDTADWPDPSLLRLVLFWEGMRPKDRPLPPTQENLLEDWLTLLPPTEFRATVPPVLVRVSLSGGRVAPRRTLATDLYLIVDEKLVLHKETTTQKLRDQFALELQRLEPRIKEADKYRERKQAIPAVLKEAEHRGEQLTHLKRYLDLALEFTSRQGDRQQIPFFVYAEVGEQPVVLVSAIENER